MTHPNTPRDGEISPLSVPVLEALEKREEQEEFTRAIVGVRDEWKGGGAWE